MKQNDFEKTVHLNNLDDRIVQEIAEQVPVLDAAAKKRIAALCEEKLQYRKDALLEANQQIHQEHVEQISRTQRWKPWMTAAACLAVTAGLAGAFFLNRQQEALRPLPMIDTMATDMTMESETSDHTETAPTETVIVICSDYIATDTAESTETAVTDIPGTQTDAIATETETITETTTAICSYPLETQTLTEPITLTFSTRTIEEPYPEDVDTKMINLAYPHANETSAEADAINALILKRVQEMVSWSQARVDEIREEALQYGNEELYQNASCSLHISEYEITRNDADYLSIVWRGDYYEYSAAHPNCFAQGLVIDKHTLTAVSLSDLYDVNPEFCAIVKEEVGTRTAAAFAEKFGGTETDFADITASVYESSLPTAGENIIDGHIFALTDSGIILDASVFHALGDYVEIHIPYEKLESFKK